MKINPIALATLAVAISLANNAFADDWQGGDATKGETVFKKCAVCHTVDEGGPNRVGPNLHGILERPAAIHPGFNYSAAMKKKGTEGLKWSEENLFKYLEKPKAFVPGTNMTFPGLKKPEDRKNLIAYLEKAAGHTE